MTPDPRDIETLAVIRKVDGSNQLGAGALAEAILTEWCPPESTATVAIVDGTPYAIVNPDHRGDGSINACLAPLERA